MNLTDTYRTFHPKEMQYIFFLNAHRTFSKIDHILAHQRNHNKFKRQKSYQASFLTIMA